MKARLPALALLSVGVSAAVALPRPLSLAVVALPLFAVLLGPVIKMDRLGQALWSIAGSLIGLLLPNVLLDAPMLHNITMLSERRALVVLALVGLASARCLIRIGDEVAHDQKVAQLRHRRGVRLTLATGLVALLAAGGALAGPVYPAMCVAFAALALSALVYADPSRYPRIRFSGRGVATVLIPVLLSASLGVSSFIYLPKLNEVAMEKLRQRMRYGRVGFSDKMDLGNMYGMLQDSRVVLRVRGERQPELLRGVVFSLYGAGRWNAPVERSLPLIVDSRAPEPLDSGWLELEHARAPERYFLPVDAEPIITSSGYHSRDKYRIFFPPEGAYAKRVWFRQQATEQPLPPQHGELSVPPALHARLVPLLARWGAAAGPLERRLERIERHLLRDYEYHLQEEPSSSTTPVEDFLFERKRGHCEYFASAFALMARSAGVPTRVVSGYRVAERSRFGYSIVRRHHAHAWVEAWVEGRWRTYDPTPAAPLAETAGETSLLGSLNDGVATGWEALDDWLEERSALEFGLLLVLLSGSFAVVRVLRSRQRVLGADASDLPLPGFMLLSERLAVRGLKKAPSETLHGFAERVEGTSELTSELAQNAAGVLRQYAGLRYGAQGDSQHIDRQLRGVAGEIEKRPRVTEAVQG